MDWKSLLGTVAPALATALGGPLAGMATKAIAAKLLGNEDAPLKLVKDAILNATPDTLLKLKQVNADFEVKMAEIGVDLEEVHAADRANARNREIQTNDNAPKILACVVVLGFFSTLAMMVFVEIPAPAMAPVNILLGSLTAMLIQVGNYYFGSSAGSARKTELMKI